jgi:putative addiction module component (TIGR02574 family)
MKIAPLHDVLDLSVDERILLAEDIWDSIAAVPESVKLTSAQKTALDKRLKAYHHNPSAGSPWEDVKKRILRAK